MSKNDPVVYTFTGKKRADGTLREWLPGVPARSLTQRDVDRLKRKGLFDGISDSPLYREARSGETKADAKAEAKADSKPAAKADAPATDAGKEG